MRGHGYVCVLSYLLVEHSDGVQVVSQPDLHVLDLVEV